MSPPLADKTLEKKLINKIADLERIILAMRSGKPLQLLELVDGVTAPSTSTGKAFIYIDTSDGDLKIKFGDGTVKTIVTDS